MPFDRPFDPDESFRWFERQRDEEHYREQALERRERFEPRPLLRCPLCHKTLDAKADCAVCGDAEDMAA